MDAFLSPYRVLDLSDERGLLAGHLLAQLGADVIQVELPRGSTARNMPPLLEGGSPAERSLYWSAYAAGKRGVTLAYDQPEGRDLLLRLASQADFLIESAGPDRMRALGLDYEALHAVNPRLIHVSITAFGSHGPKASYADSDLAIWASAGPLWPHRTAAGQPLRISVPQAFHQASTDAVCGALIALLARGATDKGQHVDVSAQASSTLCTLSAHVAAGVGHADFNLLGGVQNKRLLDLSGSGVRTRKTKWQVHDGLVEMHMGMGPAAGRYTNALFAWLNEMGELPADLAAWDWVSIPGRVESGELTLADLERARAIVGAVLARYSKDELMRIAQEKGLLLAPMLNTADLRGNDQLEARGFFAPADGGGVIPSPFVPGCGTGAATNLRAAPSLGQDNGAIYAELLNLSPDDLADLARRGII